MVDQKLLQLTLLSTYRSEPVLTAPPGGEYEGRLFFHVLRNEPLPLKKCLIGSHGPKTSVNEFKSEFVFLESRCSGLSLAGLMNNLSAVTIFNQINVGMAAARLFPLLRSSVLHLTV